MTRIIWTPELIADHCQRNNLPLPKELRLAELPVVKNADVPVAEKTSRRGRMNGLESRYAREVLDVGKHTGEIIDYWFEPIRFRIAKNTNYTCDFIVQKPSGFEAHEVKGYKFPAGWLRFKTVSEMAPFSLMFKFYLCRHIDGSWVIERFGE